MSNESYTETIRQLREEAATRQLQNIQMQARELRESTWENERLALEAHQTGDAEMARAYADMANESEQRFLEVAAQLPQQPPQMDATVAEFGYQFRPWIDKHGQRAIEALTLAHNYATRPRTGSNNPASTGMGLTYGSPAYKTAIKDLLSMYAADHGMPFDADEAMIDRKEAARISNVSDQVYDEGERKMYSEGKDSATEYGHQWDREVG